MPRRTMPEKSTMNPHSKPGDHRPLQSTREYMKAELRKQNATKLSRYFSIKRSIKWYVFRNSFLCNGTFHYVP